MKKIILAELRKSWRGKRVLVAFAAFLCFFSVVYVNCLQDVYKRQVSSLLSAFLPFRNMHQEEYQKFRIDLELQISDSYYALKEHAKVLQAMDKEAVNRIMKTLDESYQKHHSFTDITVIAFSRFTQSQAARNTALICFLIASLVDVISAILPFFWINRYNSALHGRKKHGGDPDVYKRQGQCGSGSS